MIIDKTEFYETVRLANFNADLMRINEESLMKRMNQVSDWFDMIDEVMSDKNEFIEIDKEFNGLIVKNFQIDENKMDYLYVAGCGIVLNIYMILHLKYVQNTSDDNVDKCNSRDELLSYAPNIESGFYKLVSWLRTDK
jgi:Asp-tRNA(Asn)/Glu-tRNA(Gln) amidotransferase C subunit